MTQYTAQIFIFSGRPDPTWVVAEQQALRLEEIWNQLKPSVAPRPPVPVLGYRGVSMACSGNEEFFAFGGYVKKRIGNTIEWREDEGRLFERLLLSSAPQGLLPADFMDT